MLSVKNLYLSYTKEYYTLNDINLEVDFGEHVLLLGEKESGKSSLIRVISGLETASKGEILLKNKPITQINYKKDIEMGYLSSFGAFLNNKSVRKNLEYVFKIRGYSKQETYNLVNIALLTHKLDTLSDIKVKLLSDYDKLRVAICRLSLRSLELIVVDDIFENVTTSEANKLAELVKELINKNENCSSIVATSSDTIAEMLKGRVIKLKYGSIVE